MTREERDKLQDGIDTYSELIRNADEEDSQKEEPPSPSEVTSKLKSMKARLKDKLKTKTYNLPGGIKKEVRVPTSRRAASAMEMQLCHILAPLIPDVDILGIDMSMVLGPILSLFAPKMDGPMRFVVVDGGNEAWNALEEKFGEEGIPDDLEEKLLDDYGITIPGELAKKVMSYKSTMKFGQMMVTDYGSKLDDND